MEITDSLAVPFGWLRITANESEIVEIVRADAPFPLQCTADSALLLEAKAELAAYFSGRLRRFTLPLARCGTPFQQTVWSALAQIPYGETVSYGELADKIGCPGAARAVGNAVGKNPFLILVPCHRVIRADGGLGGFSAGLDAKRILHRIEGIRCK